MGGAIARQNYERSEGREAGFAAGKSNLIGLEGESLGFVDNFANIKKENFRPFLEAGQQAVEPVTSFASNPQEQAGYLRNNPIFQDTINRSETDIKNSMAAQGLLNSTDTRQLLSENYLSQGNKFIGDQMNLSKIPINIGLQGAAQTANTLQDQSTQTIDINRNISNTLSEIENFRRAEREAADRRGKAASLGAITTFTQFLTGAPGGKE